MISKRITKRLTHCLLCLGAMLLLAGCATNYMAATTLVESPDTDKAMVNFVWPNIMGQGAAVKPMLWDSASFIGNLNLGGLVQYQTQPGNHVFMVTDGVNWGFVKADLAANKQYFLKVNFNFMGQISLGVADAPKDTRVATWLTFKPEKIDSAKMAEFDPSDLSEAQKMQAELEAGLHKYAELKPEHGI